MLLNVRRLWQWNNCIHGPALLIMYVSIAGQQQNKCMALLLTITLTITPTQCWFASSFLWVWSKQAGCKKSPLFNINYEYPAEKKILSWFSGLRLVYITFLPDHVFRFSAGLAELPTWPSEKCTKSLWTHQKTSMTKLGEQKIILTLFNENWTELDEDFIFFLQNL